MSGSGFTLVVVIVVIIAAKKLRPLPPLKIIIIKIKILGAFEANAFSEQDLRVARERWVASSKTKTLSSLSVGGVSGAVGAVAAFSPSGNKRKRGASTAELEGETARGAGSGGYFGLKYLTSSRLLRLQLRDPTLRLQVMEWKACFSARYICHSVKVYVRCLGLVFFRLVF